MSNRQTSEAGFWEGGDELVRLVLRAYTDPTATPETRTQAMDVFDRLMEHATYAAQQALAEWDRR